jgi:ribosomal protein S21
MEHRTHPFRLLSHDSCVTFICNCKFGKIGDYMAYVTPREGETPESLVNRFRASVQHAGILRELKDRRFFRSKAQKERLAAQRAARRRRRQRR